MIRPKSWFQKWKKKWKKNNVSWRREHPIILPKASERKINQLGQSFSPNPFHFHYLLWNNIHRSNSSSNTKTGAVLWVSLEFLTPNAHKSPSSEIKPIVWSKSFVYTITGAVSWVSREYLTPTFIDRYPYTLFLIHHNWGNFWDSCVCQPDIHILLLLWRVYGDNVPARLSHSPSHSFQTFLAFTHLWIQTCVH